MTDLTSSASTYLVCDPLINTLIKRKNNRSVVALTMSNCWTSVEQHSKDEKVRQVITSLDVLIVSPLGVHKKTNDFTHWKMGEINFFFGSKTFFTYQLSVFNQKMYWMLFLSCIMCLNLSAIQTLLCKYVCALCIFKGGWGCVQM